MITDKDVDVCPFCGDRAQIYDKHNRKKRLVWYAQCTNTTDCRAEVGPFDTFQEAYLAWNRRDIDLEFVCKNLNKGK